jgi:hypothetical protein
MNWFGLIPDSGLHRVNLSGAKAGPLTLKQSLCYGGVGFCLASVAVFAVVGCGRPWMYRYLGELGPYLVATALFILLAGSLLSRLVIGPGRLARFTLLFSVAFFCYAASWVVAYLKLRNLWGELLGSVTGTLLMALILASAFRAKQALPRLMPVLVLASSAGYLLGRLLYVATGGTAGMLLFGAAYGLGFGTGLGYALFVAQESIRQRLPAPPPEDSRSSNSGI